MVLVTFVSRFYKLSPEFWRDKLLIWAALLAGFSAIVLLTTTRWFDALAVRKKLSEVLLNWIGRGLILLFLAEGICFLAADDSIWLDEAYSVLAARLSWSEMLEAQTVDVHPPLYFIMLKLFAAVFGENFAVLQFFSLFPVLMTMAAGWLFLKKEFSAEGGILFLLCFFVLYPILIYSVELRMYAWASFFVTLTALFMWYAARSGKARWWMLVSMFAGAAALTHHYAALAVAVEGLFLFLYAFLRERALLRKVVFTGIGGFLLYAPWLPFVLRKFGETSQELVYWITPLGVRGILEGFLFEFRGKNMEGTFFLLLCFSGALCLFFKRRGKGRRDFFIFSGVCVWGLFCVISIGVSLFVSPLLVPRYLFPAFILPWLFFAAESSLNLDRRQWVVLCAAFFSLGILTFADTLEERKEAGKQYVRFSEGLVSKITGNNVLVFPPALARDSSAYGIVSVSCLFPENLIIYLPHDSWFPRLRRHFASTYAAGDIPDLKGFEGNEMWFFLTPSANECVNSVPAGVEFHGKFQWFATGMAKSVYYLYRVKNSPDGRAIFEKIGAARKEKESISGK
jgi:uncharacterized membrane protein